MPDPRSNTLRLPSVDPRAVSQYRAMMSVLGPFRSGSTERPRSELRLVRPADGPVAVIQRQPPLDDLQVDIGSLLASSTSQINVTDGMLVGPMRRDFLIAQGLFSWLKNEKEKMRDAAAVSSQLAVDVPGSYRIFSSEAIDARVTEIETALDEERRLEDDHQAVRPQAEERAGRISKKTADKLKKVNVSLEEIQDQVGFTSWRQRLTCGVAAFALLARDVLPPVLISGQGVLASAGRATLSLGMTAVFGLYWLGKAFIPGLVATSRVLRSNWLQHKLNRADRRPDALDAALYRRRAETSKAAYGELQGPHASTAPLIQIGMRPGERVTDAVDRCVEGLRATALEGSSEWIDAVLAASTIRRGSANGEVLKGEMLTGLRGDVAEALLLKGDPPETLTALTKSDGLRLPGGVVVIVEDQKGRELVEATVSRLNDGVSREPVAATSGPRHAR